MRFFCNRSSFSRQDRLSHASAGIELVGINTTSGHTASARAGGDGHDHHGHHGDHHHGDAEAGAYVTLAVDFLHNVIDGIGWVPRIHVRLV